VDDRGRRGRGDAQHRHHLFLGDFHAAKVGPRTVAMIGVALWGLGNVLAGLGTASWGAPWLYVTYGVLGGVGAGMAYITPLAVVTKWFPDRKGLAGGLVAGAFGLGAFVYNQVVPRLRGFHTAAVHAGGFITARAAAAAAGTNFDPTTLARPQIFSAEDIAAVMHVFLGSGVVFLIVGLAAASLFRNPAPAHGLIRPQLRPQREGPQCNAVFILTDLTKVSAALIAPLFALVSIFNALGRCLWGAISDRIGCNHTFAAMFAVQAATLLLLAHVHSLVPALGGVSVILLCCGGGPLIAARAKDLSGSFAGILPLMAVVLSACVILPYLTKKPAQRSIVTTPRVPRISPHFTS
jgi:MFS transporter, OFA family, oxalate/formate antiporter